MRKRRDFLKLTGMAGIGLASTSILDVNALGMYNLLTSCIQVQEKNSLGIKMILVEPGSFKMGSPEQETLLPCDRWDEEPVHDVTIKQPFLISSTEITNAQYEQFDPEHRKWRGLRGVSKDDNEAVTYVSWHEAMAFCKWLSKKEGKPYRLPTEAEWEYACRAGTTAPYWTGNELPEDHHRNQWIETDNRQTNAKDRALRDKKGKIEISLEVGTMPANPWGLHEMHGGVEEWVLDWYGPYPKNKQINPVGPADGLFKVTRGGSHNTALKFLRSANRSATLPEDKNWIIGFRIVQAPLPVTDPVPAVSFSMDDQTVNPNPVSWNKPVKNPVFFGPIPFVKPDTSHPLLSELHHHHHPTITWCDNGDLLAAWFNTISEIGREMVIVSSRLRYRENEWSSVWDTNRIFFAPADRNTTGSCLLNDGYGRLYFFNSIGASGHHKDQCMIMSISENNGISWTRPQIISNLFDRHKYTPQDSAFVENNGERIILSVDYAPVGHKENQAGSGVFISEDRGNTWIDKISGKSRPKIEPGNTDELVAGFHINTVRLEDGRLLAMARGQTGDFDINGHIAMSYSDDGGDTWTYRESPFQSIGSGQRLVLMRLHEGPLLFVSFEDKNMFIALSMDEGATWTVRKHLAENNHGYLAATQTPDNMIHLITSREYYRFNLPWILQN